jgi:hypothetical protein
MREACEVMAALAASGLSADQHALVMELCAALGRPVRTARQERNAKHYQVRKERLKASETPELRPIKTDEASELRPIKTIKTVSDGEDAPLNDAPTLPSTVENNLNPPKESTPKGVPKKVPNRWPEGTIERIWAAYPHKVGKKAAVAKLHLLERDGEVTPEEILDGIERYKLSKPAHHDWKNPATWLNQGCWADEYGPTATGPPQGGQQSFRVVNGTNGAPHVNGKRVSPYRGSLAEAARDSLNEALVRSNEGEGIHPDISRRLSFIGRG